MEWAPHRIEPVHTDTGQQVEQPQRGEEDEYEESCGRGRAIESAQRPQAHGPSSPAKGQLTPTVEAALRSTHPFFPSGRRPRQCPTAPVAYGRPTAATSLISVTHPFGHPARPVTTDRLLVRSSLLEYRPDTGQTPAVLREGSQRS
ncbi:hypothetical protein HRbin41_01197 [bacterium HR41]|nr:hypothetical protein HRbin41_01197 [bacterium HR41]